MLREVILQPTVLTVDNATADNGYAFRGDKGVFILSKDTTGKFIWVRVTPGKVAKPVHAYDTIKEALTAKIEKDYAVFAYDTVDDLVG